MLAVDSGCDLDVERGPDWLLIRVRKLDLSDLCVRRWQSRFGV